MKCFPGSGFDFFTAVLVLLLFCAGVFADPITDIKVNDEPDSSRFFSISASLHVLSSDRFLATWYDNRYGNILVWANIMDAEGNILFDDFKLPGNETVVPYKNKYSIARCIRRSVEFESYWTGTIHHFQNNTLSGGPVVLYDYLKPECTLDPEEHPNGLCHTTWGLLQVFNECGTLNWGLQQTHFPDNPPDWNILLRNEPDHFGNEYFNTVEHYSLTTSADSSEAWIIFAAIDYLDRDFERIYYYLARIGEYTARPNVKKLFSKTTAFDHRKKKWLEAQTIDDSTLALIWSTGDSLFSSRIDTSGTMRSYQDLPFEAPEWPEANIDRIRIKNRLFSNIVAGKRYLFLNIDLYGTINGNSTKKNTANIYEITNLTEINPVPVKMDINNTAQYSETGDLFLNQNGDLFLAGIQDHQSKLFQLNGSGLGVIDDLHYQGNGSNQHNVRIKSVNKNEFAVSYYESEYYNHACLFNMNGEKLRTMKNVPLHNGFFMHNGQTFMKMDFREVKTDYHTLFMQLWDTVTWTMREEIELPFHVHNYIYYPLDENNFFIATHSTVKIHLWKYNTEGALLDTLSVSKTPYTSSPLTMYPSTNGRFWIRSESFYLWDSHANKMAGVAELTKNTPYWPLNDEKFLIVNYLFDPIFGYGTFVSVVDTSQTELISGYPFAGTTVCSRVQILPLTQEYFVFFYRAGAKYYFQILNTDLIPLTAEQIEPFPLATKYAHGASVKRIGHHLVFGITDIREDGAGTDVFFSIFDLPGIITGVHNTKPMSNVPGKFVLSLPSPNPGFANGQITFSLTTPQSGRFDISLYNILGQRVFRQKQFIPKGSQQLQLRLPALPTGVYFIKAESTGRSQVRKFLIFK